MQKAAAIKAQIAEQLKDLSPEQRESVLKGMKDMMDADAQRSQNSGESR